MADENRPEESEGVTPNLERATLVKLDDMDWHVIEHIFVDYIEQSFDEYAETENDIEELRSNAIGIYGRLCEAWSMFNELAQADVIINNLSLTGGNKPSWMFIND